MTLFTLYELTNYIIRHESRGVPFTPSQFERIINFRQLDYFHELYNKFEGDTANSDSLRTFKVLLNEGDISVINDSYFAIPSNWFHFSSMSYIDGNLKYHPFDMVTKSEAIMRKSSTITAPSTTYPICYQFDNKIYIEPYDNTLEMSIAYLRYPNAISLSYRINSDDEFEYYTESGSVSIPSGTELEWNEDDQLKILEYILRDVGIDINSQGVYQYANLLKNES